MILQQIKYGVYVSPVLLLCIWLFLAQLANYGWQLEKSTNQEVATMQKKETSSSLAGRELAKNKGIATLCQGNINSFCSSCKILSAIILPQRLLQDGVVTSPGVFEQKLLTAP